LVVELICEFMGYHGEIAMRPRRGADVDCHNATNELVMSLIDFQTRDFKEGLADTVEWYRRHLS